MPRHIALLLIVVALMLAVIGVGSHWRGYGQHQTCKARRIMIAKAESIYWLTHHRFVIGEEQALKELVRTGLLSETLLHCKQGGRYWVADRGDGMVIVHCSIEAHDNGKGIKRRPDPLIDAPQR